MSADPDELLVEGARKGSPDRFDALVDRYQRVLFRFFVGHRMDPDTAADLVQETLLRTYRSLERFDAGRSTFKTWLFTIAFNLLRDRARRQKVRVREMERLEREEAHAGAVPDPHDQVEARDQVLRLLEAVDEESRSLLVLRFLNDLPYSEIAAVTGLAEPTIRSKVHRALKRIQGTAGATA